MLSSKLLVKEGFVNTYTQMVNETQVNIAGDIVPINQNACQSCGKCVKICPLAVIELTDNKAVPLKVTAHYAAYVK